MPRSRVLLRLLPVLLLSPALGCTAYLVRSEIPEHATAGFDKITEVCVDTSNGEILIDCDPTRKDVDIRAVKFARGLTPEDAREHAERIGIESEPDAGKPTTLRVAAVIPTMESGRGPGVDFHIALPPSATLRLHTRNGRVTVDGARAGLTATTSNGRMIVRNVRGDIELRTSNGAIEARDVEGNADLHTSNGGITLTRVGRTRLAAETTNGDIRADAVAGDMRLWSSNGRIELRVASVTDKPRIEAVTSNGRVLVELPKSVSARLDVRTSNGRVVSLLSDLKDCDIGRAHLRATLNDGRGTVRIKSSNGSITIQTAGAAGAAPAEQTDS